MKILFQLVNAYTYIYNIYNIYNIYIYTITCVKFKLLTKGYDKNDKIYSYSKRPSVAPAKDQPLQWIHAKLPQLREFLLHQKASGRFTPQPGLEL